MKSIAEISRLDTKGKKKKNSSELECRKIENIQRKGTESNFKRSVRQYQAV